MLATQPQNLVNGLDRAFDFIDSRLSSASSASVNSGSISDLTRIYQTRFNSGTWTGQLLAFAINDDGTLGNGVPPLTDAEAEWDAAQELPAWGSRQIITRDSTGAEVAVPLGLARHPARRRSSATSTVLEYLRGDDTNEGNVRRQIPAARSSASWVTSSPRRRCSSAGRRSATATISKDPAASTYSTFVAANDTDAERTPMVYAGANDGMLHGFNANTGVGSVRVRTQPDVQTDRRRPLARITKLAQQNYVHEYFVDGSPSLGDAYWGGAWHTVIAGGLNKGGQGIYALDVTSTSRLAAAETPANAQAHDPVGVHRRQRCRPGLHVQSAVDREVARHDRGRHGSLGRRFRQRLQQHAHRRREQHDR